MESHQQQQQQQSHHNSLSPVANKAHRGNGMNPADFLSDDDNSEHNIDNMGYNHEHSRQMNQQLVQMNPGLALQQMQAHLQDHDQVRQLRCHISFSM